MRRALRITAGIVAGLLGVVLVTALWLARPLGEDELASQPEPALTYATAERRLKAIEAAEATMPLQPVGRTIALTHGSRVETAVVIFHGYTQVPAQFSAIARAYFDAGANVYIARMPYHGYADRMTDDPSEISPDTLREAADSAVDIASGLGRNVEVVGISGGGALAAWTAAERPEVTRAVLISPLMLPSGYPPWVVRPLSRASSALPDTYTWWSEKQQAEPGPAYPRYSRHGITSYLMTVERAKADGADGATPVDAEVVVITNRSDQFLDTEYPVQVIEPLISEKGSLRRVIVPASEGLGHDLVAVDGENADRIDVAYRYLSEAIGLTLDPRAQLPDY